MFAFGVEGVQDEKIAADAIAAKRIVFFIVLFI
jgi:hypothetical protein